MDVLLYIGSQIDKVKARSPSLEMVGSSNSSPVGAISFSAKKVKQDLIPGLSRGLILQYTSLLNLRVVFILCATPFFHQDQDAPNRRLPAYRPHHLPQV